MEHMERILLCVCVCVCDYCEGRVGFLVIHMDIVKSILASVFAYEDDHASTLCYDNL